MIVPEQRRSRFALMLSALSLLSALVSQSLWAGGDVHLVVDTERLTVRVFKGRELMAFFNEAAIGRFGATQGKRRGDGATPKGRYRVAWIKSSDKFHHFIGLDYPSVADAERGLRNGVIDLEEKQAIERAHRHGKAPPQTTALGGYIGFHGIGDGDPEVHTAYNWTQGCIALTNVQIDHLLNWVTLGTQVEIR